MVPRAIQQAGREIARPIRNRWHAPAVTDPDSALRGDPGRGNRRHHVPRGPFVPLEPEGDGSAGMVEVEDRTMRHAVNELDVAVARREVPGVSGERTSAPRQRRQAVIGIAEQVARFADIHGKRCRTISTRSNSLFILTP